VVLFLPLHASLTSHFALSFLTNCPSPNFPSLLQPKDMLRFNLLKIPPLRRFLRSSLWPEDINHK
jgi:hypothetical protein